MMLNTPRDFDRPRALAQFDALITPGRGTTERLLAQERLSQDCFVAPARVQALGRSTVDARGQRAAALRFGDQRVMALMAAPAQWAHLPRRYVRRWRRCWAWPTTAARRCPAICGGCGSRGCWSAGPSPRPNRMSELCCSPLAR